MDMVLPDNNTENIQLGSNGNEATQTEFDKFVYGYITKIVKKLEPKDFVQDHLAIEIEVNGYNEGTFYLEVKTDDSTGNKSIDVKPYNYNDHDIRIEGDYDDIIQLLKKHSVMNEEIQKGKLVVTTKLDGKEAQKLINQLSYNLSPGDIYSFFKTNLFTNLKFLIVVIAAAFLVCSVLSLLVSRDKSGQLTTNTVAIFLAIGMTPLLMLNQSLFKKLPYFLINMAFSIIALLTSFLLFMECFTRYNDTYNNNKTVSVCFYLFMTAMLLIACLVFCYYVLVILYGVWGLISKACFKLFTFRKTEDGKNIELSVKSQMLIKIIAVISTILAVVAYITPIIAAILDLLKK